MYDSDNLTAKSAAMTGRSLAGHPAVSPFKRVEVAAEMLGALEIRVRDLASRLVGPAPESGETADGQRLSPNGMLGELDELSLAMSARIDRMQRAVERIERLLP